LPVVIAPVRREDQVSWTVGRTLSPHLDQRICFPKRLSFRISWESRLMLSEPDLDSHHYARHSLRSDAAQRKDCTKPTMLTTVSRYRIPARDVPRSVSHADVSPFALESCQPPASNVRRAISALSCPFWLHVGPCRVKITVKGRKYGFQSIC
jgi:hypothetical protein